MERVVAAFKVQSGVGTGAVEFFYVVHNISVRTAITSAESVSRMVVTPPLVTVIFMKPKINKIFANTIQSTYLSNMKKAYTLKIEQELIGRIQKQAEKENRSVSNLIETVMKAYVEKAENKEWLES